MLFVTTYNKFTELSLHTFQKSRTELSIHYVGSNNMFFTLLSFVYSLLLFFALKSLKLYIHWMMTLNATQKDHGQIGFPESCKQN